ncbi:UV radiation resistance protein and autophagy-related subunit 14-domain-containing protein [Phycomyces nitens]|nr:UV radiation resistance protein and autophagy-related subunit 14-domain-containing protein [Phycomyces nitens]
MTFENNSNLGIRQRRIRHIRSIAGRNIVWYEDNELLANVISTISNPSSINSSADTSRASSPSPISSSALRHAFDQQQKGHGHHKRIGSSPLDLTTNQPELPLVASASATITSLPQHHLMRRSESTSSMRSSNSTTVEDSSITKSAYKFKKMQLQLQQKRITIPQKEPAIKEDQEDQASIKDIDQEKENEPKEEPREEDLEDKPVSLEHEERGLLDTYVTLHLSSDETSFYCTETIPNTINPSFCALDVSEWVDWHDGVQTVVVARLWARHSVPESASLANGCLDPIRAGHKDRSTDSAEGFQLLLEWKVELNGLVYIGKTLQNVCVGYPENTLIFELDDGFYSAPDIVSKLNSSSKRTSVVESTIEPDNSSVNTESSQTKKRSYTYTNIVRLCTLKECLFDTQKSTDEVRQAIGDILETDKERFRLLRERNQRQKRVDEINTRLGQQQQLNEQQQQRIDALQKKIDERKARLAESEERFKAGTGYLEDSEAVLESNTKMHRLSFNQLDRRKKELIADLFSIYPIEQKSYDDLQQFCIRGVHLPNSVYTGCKEESIATALGFTAHLVSMLAFYLSIPLRYPITPMGSRATIKDLVSLIGGPKDFPLYSKGVDSWRFEFGVFLLNKNIEQLMNAYGLIVIDLRFTLPNIHYFIQAILTTSVTSGPTSISVLSISSYANNSARYLPNERPRLHSLENGFSESDNAGYVSKSSGSSSSTESGTHNRLTLQPTIHIPSPTKPVQPKNGSPSVYASAAFLNTPQAMAAPAILDTVTTSSRKPHQLASTSIALEKVNRSKSPPVK